MEAKKLNLLGQFWLILIFPETQLLSRIVRLNGPCKIPAKTPSEVAGEDGIDSDINFKKKEQIVIFCSSNLESSSALCLEGPNPYIEV